MNRVHRQWDLLSPEKRASCIAEIITFFKREREETIGILAAESILDLLLQSIGCEIYNRGVEDSKKALENNFDDLKLDLDLLLKK